MKSVEAVFEVELPSLGRGSGGHEDTITVADQRTWTEAVKVFSTVQLDGREGPITVRLDWTEPLRITIETAQIEVLPMEKAFKVLRELPRGWHKAKLRCKLSADLPDRAEDIQRRHLGHHLDILLHYIFLSMNLSSPGSCNFFGARYEVNPKEETELNLNTTLLEAAYLQSIEQNWPPIQRISVTKTWKWLKNLGIGFHQIARDRTERALFALLHVCRESSYNPSSLIWLAHGLEALYDSPPGMIFQALQNRIFLVLGDPPTHKRKVKKSLRQFYELRSAYVHGRFDVSHPAEIDFFDDRYEGYQKKLMDAHDIAIVVIMATLQRLVKRHWKQIEFMERHVGRRFPTTGDGI